MPNQLYGYAYNYYFATNSGIPLAQINLVSKQMIVGEVQGTALSPAQGSFTLTGVDRIVPTNCTLGAGDARFQAISRHQGGQIMIFADGHAKYIKDKQGATRINPIGNTATVACGKNNTTDPAYGTYWLPTDTSP